MPCLMKFRFCFGAPDCEESTSSLPWFPCLYFVLEPSGITSPSKFDFLETRENPTPFDLIPKFSCHGYLWGEISWGYILGVGTKLSSKFHLIWTRFALDSRFGIKFSGFSGRHRSDRLERLVRPVCLFLNCLTGQTALLYRSDRSVPELLHFELVLMLLLPHCNPSFRSWDSLSIAILTDLGLRVCGDFGTSADGFEISKKFWSARRLRSFN